MTKEELDRLELEAKSDFPFRSLESLDDYQNVVLTLITALREAQAVIEKKNLKLQYALDNGCYILRMREAIAIGADRPTEGRQDSAGGEGKK